MKDFFELRESAISKRYGKKDGKPVKESVEVDEAKLSDMEIHNKLANRNLLIKAIKTAEKMGGNMTGAVREIEKMKKGLSKHKAVQAALQQANESVEVKDFFNLRESLTEDHLKIGQKVKTSDGKVGTVRAAGKGDQKGDYIIAVDGKTMSCNKSDLTVVESTDINENYRTLARAGMGTESKGEARVGLELDYYDGSGTKRMGKITKVTPKGYIVKDEKDGKNRQFTFHDRAKAKEILARLGKGKYNESVEESVDLTEAVTVPRAEFDKLKKGDEVTITYDSSIRKGTTNTFVVKGKSRSAKYNVDKVSMQLKGKPGGMKFFLYSRSGKDATLALGDMGATMTSFKKGS